MDLGALKDLFAEGLFEHFPPNARYDNLVFFDVETTGFDADKADRIIELAAIQVDKGGNCRQEDLLVQLPEGRSVPDKIVNLTGITDLMLLTGVTDEEAARVFDSMLKPSWASHTLLIAHNAQFDLNFTAFMFMRHMKEHPEWLNHFMECDYLDTLTVYKDRRAYPHKLESAIISYNLQDRVQNTHRAIDDVMALFEVAKAMEAERADLLTYVNIFGFNPKYGVSGKQLKKVTYHSQRFRDYMCSEQFTLPAIIHQEGGKTDA